VIDQALQDRFVDMSGCLASAQAAPVEPVLSLAE
jgi:hypothetical protein